MSARPSAAPASAVRVRAQLPAVLRAQADALEAQARVLRAYADELELVGAAGPAPTRYATATDNPMGTERGFRAACARGAFPSFPRGRKLSARWEDVERYIESRQRPVRAADDPDLDALRDELADAGVQLRRAKKRGGQ